MSIQPSRSSGIKRLRPSSAQGSSSVVKHRSANNSKMGISYFLWWPIEQPCGAHHCLAPACRLLRLRLWFWVVSWLDRYSRMTRRLVDAVINLRAPSHATRSFTVWDCIEELFGCWSAPLQVALSILPATTPSGRICVIQTSSLCQRCLGCRFTTSALDWRKSRAFFQRDAC